MNFDLNTAIAVRERDDGLLEKDAFNLSTAVPVEAEISAPKEPFRYSPPLTDEQKAQAVVELSYKEHGEKVPFGLKVDWALTSGPAKLATTNILGAIASGGIIPFYNIAKGIANAESPNSDIGKMIFDSAYKGLAENQKVDNLGGAAAKAYPEAPWQITGAMGAAAEVLMFMPGVVKSVGEFLSPDKQFVIALNRARQSPKWGDFVNYVSKKEGQPIEVVDKELYRKLWEVRKEANPFKYYGNNLKKVTGIDIFSEAGSIPVKRAKIGQVVNFTDPQGMVKVGKITELVGERATIAMDGREVIATLSQLSLPEAPKQPVLSTPKPQGGTISPKTASTEGKVDINPYEIPTKKVGEVGSVYAPNTAMNGNNQFLAQIDRVTQSGGKMLVDFKHFDNPKDAGEWIKNHNGESSKEAQEKWVDYGDKLKNIAKDQNRADAIDVESIGQQPPIEPPKTAVSGSPEEQPKPIIKNLNISEGAKASIEEASGQIKPELEKVKGKPLTHDEVVEAAQQSDILSKVISREESKDFEARLLRTRQHLASMAEGKGVTQEFIDTLKTVKSFGTDAARKLGSLRIGAEASEFNIKTKLVNDLLEKNVEIDDIVKAAEGVDFNNQEQVTEFYRQFVKPKIWDIINEYRYINLLSSPKTHIVNTFSNLIQVSGLAPGTKIFAGDIKGATAFYRGAWNSIGDAGTKALDAFKGKSFIERPDITHIPTGTKLLKWGRWIPQALEASDVFFRTIAYEGERAAQLAKGTDPKEAEKLAKDKASYYVFRKALDPQNKTGQGKLLSAIDNLTTLAYKARSIPIFGRVISWYIPFVQTPMNIAKQMIEYSPAGFSTIPGAKDKRGQLAKALLGSLIFGTAAYLVSKNDTTWGVPTGKKEKDLFFASGRQPFSIKIGNVWVGYSRLGPLAFPIAIPAAIKNYTQENPKSVTDTALQKTSKVIGGIGEFFASMSYVEGVGQLMQLVKNAPGALSKLVGEAPSQLIPLSSLQRWINNFILDPIYRKTDKDISVEAIIENARKSIIFATKGLPGYESPEGEASRRSYPGLNAFSPIPLSESNQDYEAEYKDYIEQRKEDIIDNEDTEDNPSRGRRRGRR